MKHTPGPWVAVYTPSMNLAGVHIRARGNNLEIAYCNETDNERPEADARLMAAAPELLEIAKAYRNLLKTMAHSDGEVATYHHIESVLLKAIGGTE